MEISINQKSCNLPDHSSVQQLLSSFSYHDPKGLAVAVNDQIIPRSDWASHVLALHDRVTLVKATQGG